MGSAPTHLEPLMHVEIGVSVTNVWAESCQWTTEKQSFGTGAPVLIGL